jgi:hypothetical protein
MQNTSRCSEVETRFPGLIPAILNALKAQVENRLAATENKPAQNVK